MYNCSVELPVFCRIFPIFDLNVENIPTEHCYGTTDSKSFHNSQHMKILYWEAQYKYLQYKSCIDVCKGKTPTNKQLQLTDSEGLNFQMDVHAYDYIIF
jgi:hypothetical protein